MGFSKQKYWLGLPCPPPGESPLLRDGISLLHLLHWQADSLPLNHLGILPSSYSHLLYLPGEHRVLPLHPLQRFLFVCFYSMQSPFYSLTSKEENNIWILREQNSIHSSALFRSLLHSPTTCECTTGLTFSLVTGCQDHSAVLSRSVISDSLWPLGLLPTGLLCLRGFSRQECWSGLPCRLPGDLPNVGVEPRSLLCRQILYQLSHRGSPSRVP